MLCNPPQLTRERELSRFSFPPKLTSHRSSSLTATPWPSPLTPIGPTSPRESTGGHHSQLSATIYVGSSTKALSKPPCLFQVFPATIVVLSSCRCHERVPRARRSRTRPLLATSGAIRTFIGAPPVALVSHRFGLFGTQDIPESSSARPSSSRSAHPRDPIVTRSNTAVDRDVGAQ